MILQLKVLHVICTNFAQGTNHYEKYHVLRENVFQLSSYTTRTGADSVGKSLHLLCRVEPKLLLLRDKLKPVGAEGKQIYTGNSLSFFNRF